MTYELAGGQHRATETFTVLKQHGTNMAHRPIEACINRAIVGGIRQLPSDMGISLDQGRVLVMRDAV